MNVSAFAELFAIPNAPRLVTAALLGRLPGAVAPLTIVLAVHQRTGSYAAAGLASACYAAGAGLAGPPLGRLIDHAGQPPVLAASAAISSAAWVGLAVAGHASVAVLAGGSGLAGAFQPPLAPCMRALWPALVRQPAQLEAAYTLESTSQELLYITGPLLLAALVAVASPLAVPIASALLGLAGTLLFVSTPAARAWTPTHRPRHWAGALTGAGIRWLLLTRVVWTSSAGMLFVAIPAFCGHHGSAAAAGLIIAAWGAASMAGGILYGGRRWRSSLQTRFVVLLALLAATAFPLALARSIVDLALLVSLFGLGLAPWLASADALTQAAAPQGTLTEAFTWAVAAGLLGQALGGSLAGALLQTNPATTSFVVAAALLVLATAIAGLAVRRIPNNHPMPA
jgi:MFS family permease